MKVLAPLVPYLLIGLGLWYVLNLRGMKYFRQAMYGSGDLMNQAWTGLAAMGQDEPTDGSMTHEVFPATLGLRAVSTALVTLLMVLLCPYPILSDGLPFVGRFAIEEYVLAWVIAGYYLFWIHTYKVEIHGHWLIYRNFWMMPRKLDLRRLEDVEDNRQYSLVLFFDDGKRGEVFKTVRGSLKLKRKLVRWLEINTRL